MRRSPVSVGLALHRAHHQRNQLDCLGVSPPPIVERLAPLLSRKHLQSIGCYLKRGFGNVRYRFLRDLGSTTQVACVVELVYPAWANGIIVGIPRRVVQNPRRASPSTKGERG